MSNDANGYWSLANYVGQGFNVYGAYDMTSTTGLLFDFPEDTGHDFSFQGKTFRIPITVLGAESVNTYFQHVSGSTRESYQDSLATSANVQVGIGAFSGDLKASFSSEFQTASEFAFDRYTSYSKLGTLELRVDPSNITASLASAIDKLPATSNPGNLQVFADFFQRFGVYFIWRVVFGGSLQLYTAVNKASGLSTQDISVEAEASYGALFKAGMKVATSSRRETFNKNAFTSVNAIGGDLKLAAQLGLADPNAPSADSVKLFVDWVGTVAASPAPVDFSLKGIWELCGDKRQAVETAWALYAQLMHPKLTIQTYGLPAPTQLPIITLGRQLKPAPAASQAGFQSLPRVRPLLSVRETSRAQLSRNEARAATASAIAPFEEGAQKYAGHSSMVRDQPSSTTRSQSPFTKAFAHAGRTTRSPLWPPCASCSPSSMQ